MDRIQRIAISFLLSLFIFPISTSALDPNRAITQYVVDLWNLDKGLPNFFISDIAQTPDGYLWVATYGGLVRFDGVRFKLFDSSASAEIPTAQCYALLTSRDGTLWIGTYSKGLLAYKNGKFRRYTSKDGLSDERIVEIHEDRSGNLWLGTPTGVIRMRNNQFTSFGSKEGLPAHIWSIYEDHKGMLWAGSIGGGTFQFQNNKFVPYLPVTEKGIYCFLEDSKQNFWIGTVSGLYRITNGNIKKYSTPDLPAEKVINLLEDRKRNIWITTVNGLARFRHDTFERFTPANGFPGEFAGAMYEDAEENLWVGVSEIGLVRLHDGKFTSYSKEEGLAEGLVASIHGSKDGSIWLTHDLGISNLRNAKIKNFLFDPKVNQAPTNCVMEDSAGTVWIGTEGGGLHNLKDGKLIPFPETDKIVGRTVRSLYEDQPGSLWAGNFGRGVTHIENGKVTATFGQSEGLSSISYFHKDKDGSLLVLTEDGVRQYQNGRFSVYISQKLLVDNVWTIYRDSNDILWMGSRGGGLKRYAKGKVVSIKKNHGLITDIVANILEDASGIFWITSDKGIFSVSKKELNEFAEGKIGKVHCSSYGKADGLKSAESDFGVQPSSWKSPDGKLWFPTFNGVSMIDPQHITKNNVPPPVKLEEFTVDDKAVAADVDPLILQPGRKRLEFHYTALSFRVPERVKFRYKLEGYDQNWQEAGMRRAASYMNLSPGPYRFWVIASNDDDVWNETGASISFRLKPFFYQTKWFYGAIILTVMSIGYVAYRVRVRSLKAREEHLVSVVEERTVELRQANIKLIEAQDRITRLLESQPQAIENIPAWSESIANDVAKVIGASSISVWVREDENFRSWSGEETEPINLQELQKNLPLATTNTERIVLPVTGGTGEIYGALKISGKSAAWGETEKRLILGFANQLGSTLEMQQMRKDLTSVREKMELRIHEFHAKGISTVQVCSHCSRCFDETAVNCPVDGAALRVPHILPYRIFDRYRMLRFLGQGGTGIVFQAEDEKLHRHVAVKILRKEYPDDHSQSRWEREARTIARLHHPGIVGLYDIGELDDGSAVLIMEFLQGVDMARKLRIDGPGTPSQVCQLVEQVGDALRCAHETSVIHRDIKPANLFMTASVSNSFQMKVVDFGLAKLLNDEQRSLTMTGVLIGSPSYMSPEQIRGQNIDQRSDLFSFAAVIYEMLTGNVAFSAQAVPDVLVRILAEAPPPLSTYIKDVPSEIQRAFDWALEKDPQKRPTSVMQWVREIASRLKDLSSPASGWNIEHLTSEISAPSDPHSPTAQI